MSGLSSTSPASIPEEQPSRVIRWFVRLFLAAFVVGAVFGIEAFPLTGFRLFSHLRHEQRATWVADTVRPNGTESPLVFTDLPRAYQGFTLVMSRFAGLSASAKAATCRAWLLEARRVRRGVASIRFYHVRWNLLPRAGDRAAGGTGRTLTYACA
jgi:hypothetical protein